MYVPNSLNVNNNPMSPYNKPTMNMIEVEEKKKLVSWVDRLKTPLIDIKNLLMKSNLFIVYDSNCEHCLINPQECEVLKTVSISCVRIINIGSQQVDP